MSAAASEERFDVIKCRMEPDRSPGASLIGSPEVGQHAGAGRIRMPERAEQAPSLDHAVRPRLVLPGKEASA